MKTSLKRCAMGVYFAVLAVSIIGVCLAYLGMLLKHDALWMTGLVLALPLFVIVLPICILLIALIPVAGVVQAALWARTHFFRRHGNDNRRTENKVMSAKDS